MQKLISIDKDIYYIGSSDRTKSLFENTHPTPHGMAYNSYLILDKKTAVVDGVDKLVEDEYFENIKNCLDGKKLDYIIFQHAEPDHSASIITLLKKHKEAKLVCTTKAKQFFNQFFDYDIDDRCITVKKGDTLSLGSHELEFIMAPMVHWPEVMMSYEKKSGIFFSADAFGSFGALSGNIISTDCSFDVRDIDEIRRYYAGIVSKYGPQVQNVLKNISNYKITKIAPLHGCVINGKQHIELLIEKYDLWSRYISEDQQVAIIYSTIYGNTKALAVNISYLLANLGIKNIKLYDASNIDSSYLLAETFRCSHIVLLASTYNLKLLPSLEKYLNEIQAHCVKNKVFAIGENGTWAITAAKEIKSKLEIMKGNEILEEKITIKSAQKSCDDLSVENFAKAIYKSINEKKENK